MAGPTGESKSEALRLHFDRRLMLQFCGSVITSDGGLLAYRELDDVLALTTSCGERLAEARTGENRRHLLVGLLRQSVLGRLAGYEDVNDAERLCDDPAMRWVVGGGAPLGRAASPSQMGRFETEWLSRPENLALVFHPAIDESNGCSGVRDRADTHVIALEGFDERLGYAIACRAFDRCEARHSVQRQAISIVRWAAKIEPLSETHCTVGCAD
jgi:Transposase DDE domain group 1